MDYYSKNKNELFETLKTGDQGLTSFQVGEKLNKFGLNKLKQTKRFRVFGIFISQFHSFIIYILISAFIISFVLGERLDAIVIGGIIVLNAIFGFFQEYNAEKAIDALKKLAEPKCTVLRDGIKQEVKSFLLVPGDIVFLEEGNYVPADCYLLETKMLKVDESHLTGESVSVSKEVGILKLQTNVSDQSNMVFSSTVIISGRAKALVVETGMETEIGKVANMIQQTKEEKTPLQEKLEKFGRKLGILVLLLSFIIFLSGYIVGNDWYNMLLIAISLAVAAIPEGLPAVVTIALAIGVQRMIRHGVIVRKLSAVETLGSATVICTDKTGTLTRNEMTVQKIYNNEDIIEVSGKGFDVKGKFHIEGKEVALQKIESIIEVGVLCNNAIKFNDKFIGDPTESALLVVGQKANLNFDYLRVNEVPFNSDDKFMSVWHKINDKEILSMKGAPEIVLNKCKFYNLNGKKIKLTKKIIDEINNVNNDFSKDALRVLALAQSEDGTEENLIFLGLMGMIDPAKDDVKESIDLCQQAGIKVVMITGDHKLTAEAIGKKIGLGGDAITGDELDKLTDKEFNEIFEDITIFARVSPAHKVKILEAYKNKDHIVAMTGDGVNDAPALKIADIGIAVDSSADVAKEASDMVLTSKNFNFIVKAVAEGRHIFNNIRKVIKYLLSCNLSELLVVFVGVISGLGVPIVAVQILWMNLVTDGLPALALSFEPISRNIMKNKPQDPQESIVNKKTGFEMAIIALAMTVIALFVFWKFKSNFVYASTAVFTVLVFMQLFSSLNCRTSKSIFKINFFGNWRLLIAILISFILQIVLIYTVVGTFFKTQPLLAMDLLYLFVISLLIIVVSEVFKLVQKFFVELKK